MTHNKSSIVAKIEALLSKTTDRGCTEEEALLAAGKAAELMKQHDISEGSLGASTGACVAVEAQWSKYGRTKIGLGFLGALANLCDCKAWITNNNVTFFGFKHDAEIVVYLFNVLSNAVVAESNRYKRSTDYAIAKRNGFNGKTLAFSFIAGMESRLRIRLREMKLEKRGDIFQATGNDLVVIKDATVSKELANLGLQFQSNKHKRPVRSASAYGAGQIAGSKVAINHALTS